MRQQLRDFVVLTFLFRCAHLHACTVCDSQAGHQLRSQLFNGHFFRTLGYIGLPWGVLCVAVLALRFALPEFASKVADDSENLEQSPLSLVPVTSRTS